MDVHNRQIQASYPHCGCVYARGFMQEECKHMCVSIQYVLSFVCTHMWMSVFDSKHMCVHVCVCGVGGWFHTPGLHRGEGPMQELLIERDLRDMAGVSMLRHAETGLWWAVETSRRLRTTNVCICACVCA